jgi:SRSO17 transposase
LSCKDVLWSGVHRWERRTAGVGSKGARLYDWSTHAVMVRDQPPAVGFGHTLLIRRSKEMRTRTGRPSSYDIGFFLVHAPVATAMAAMVRAAGLRWKIEEDNKIGKDQLGMDAYQVRKWTPWYRHVTMCMLAQAFLTVTRAGQGKEATLDESETAG